MIYLTRGLRDTLLRLAEDRDPDSTTIPLAITRARNLPDVDLDDDTPVFTHFYFPNEDGAVNAVFGVDLGTPAAQTPGVFVSHPRGDLRLSKRDDLREIVLVGVPPWDGDDDIEAFKRSGETMEYTVLDVEPPEEEIA